MKLDDLPPAYDAKLKFASKMVRRGFDSSVGRFLVIPLRHVISRHLTSAGSGVAMHS